MRQHSVAFTLVELLVVIGIISILVAVLLPTLSAANARARQVQCASNERQLGQALVNYASEWGGRFPPNTASPGSGLYWYDPDRLGMYSKPIGVPTGQPGGPVYTCPNDDEGAHLSYSMIVWASSKVDASVTSAVPPTGCLWTTGHASPSKLMLLAEAYSWSAVPNGGGYYAKQAIGFAGATAGQKFGGGTGVVGLSKGRFGVVQSELDYMRHRAPAISGVSTQPIGLLNICYEDGHVEAKRNTDLVTLAGNSRGDSLWCPADAIGP